MFKKILIIIIAGLMFAHAETELGSIYTVIRDDSPYSACEGDMAIKIIPKGKEVRLIKDETVAESVLFAPLRILKLMVNIDPRGNWIVEDVSANRGYMWDSDLKLTRKKRSR
jgi:hypothetical protein